MRVPVQPVDEAVRRSGIPLNEIARRIGWVKKGRPEGYRVARAIGRYRNGRHYNRRMTEETAEKIGRAIDADLYELGL